MDLTISQLKVITLIDNNEKYEIVNIDGSCISTILITVESKDKNFFTQESYLLSVGKRGGIKGLKAYRDLDDKKSIKVTASRFAYNVFNRDIVFK